MALLHSDRGNGVGPSLLSAGVQTNPTNSWKVKNQNNSTAALHYSSSCSYSRSDGHRALLRGNQVPRGPQGPCPVQPLPRCVRSVCVAETRAVLVCCSEARPRKHVASTGSLSLSRKLPRAAYKEAQGAETSSQKPAGNRHTSAPRSGPASPPGLDKVQPLPIAWGQPPETWIHSGET